MMRALAVGGRDLDVIRVVARAGIDPPEGWGRFDASFDRIRAGVLRVLRVSVPGVKDRDLIFRTRCAAGLLNWFGPRAGRKRAQESARDADRETAGPDSCRYFPGHHPGLSEHLAERAAELAPHYRSAHGSRLALLLAARYFEECQTIA